MINSHAIKQQPLQETKKKNCAIKEDLDIFKIRLDGEVMNMVLKNLS